MAKSLQLEKIKKLEDELKKLQEEINTEEGQQKGNGTQKIFFKWQAPSRIFIKRDRAWFVKTSFVGIILIFLMAILNDRALIVAISAILLVAFLLATVPPNVAHHEITSRGIRSIGVFYRWKDLREFWVAKHYSQLVLYVNTNIRFPGTLTLLFDKQKSTPIIQKMYQYIDYKDMDPKKQSWVSRTTEGEYQTPSQFGLIEDVSVKRPDKEPK